MAVKDRTKPIRTATTKDAAKYLGPQTLLGLTRHLVQVSCEGVLITAWLTDEDFEKGFENVPEPESRPRVDPRKPIWLRRHQWPKRSRRLVKKVECLWSVEVNGTENHFVKFTRHDGSSLAEYWQDASFQELFENVPDNSPIATITVDGEKLSGVTSVDIECDNGAAPEPHKGNGKAEREIDWKGEVEIRHKGSKSRWDDFTALHYGQEFPNVVYGAFNGQKHPGIYDFGNWEFRNKPKPEHNVMMPKWESTGDDRVIDCERKTKPLWHVWAQYPDNHSGIKFPFVVHTGTSRIAELGVLLAMRDGGAFPPGTRFAVAPCIAPVMPKATEADA